MGGTHVVVICAMEASAQEDAVAQESAAVFIREVED
jgi:hypothetical protein